MGVKVPLHGKERIVRALHLPSWDPENKRATPSAFQVLDGVSVCRLAVYDHPTILATLKRDLEKSSANGSSRKIEATMTLLVERTLTLCHEDPKIDAAVQVVEDPIQAIASEGENLSHALIETKSKQLPGAAKVMTRGMANKLIKEFPPDIL